MQIFSNVIVKSIILTILPLIYPSLFFYALSINDSADKQKDYIVVSVVLCVIHIILLTFYGIKEHKQKDLLLELTNNKDKAPKEVQASAPLLQKYSKVIQDNADKLYESVRLKKGHSDIEDWQWMRAKGDEICSELHNFIKKVAEKGNKFSVSMMFRMVENNEHGFTMLSRGSDDAAHTPRSYRKFIPEQEADGSFYKKIFDTNPTRPQILMNRKEIEKNFNDVGNVNYSQFIAMSIACKGKTVGVLQIAAYEDSKIANNKSEIERLCNNYFSIAANAMLLTDKNENVKQIL